jgi:catechol 2,3-dioxygenase-like lactoylglutathione lyase family enzyme
MDPRLSIVTLGVEDLDEAIQFYRDGLGLPMQDRDPDAGVAFFELAGAWLALYPRTALAEDATVSPEGEGFEGVTLAHNVESKAAVDAVLDEAAAAGAEIVKPAEDVFWGGYSGYFADPDGHLWEVAWNPEFEIA